MQVRNTTDASEKPGTGQWVSHLFGTFVPMETMLVGVRAFGIFLILAGTVLGGGLASAQLYRDAMPGEMLYGVKVAVEKAQLTLAPNQEYRTRLHAEFADNRMEEVARLAEAGPAGHEHIVDVLVAFENDILKLRDGLNDLKQHDADSVVEIAKTMELKMALYQNMLRKAALTVPADVRVAVHAARNRADDVAIASMAIIVEKHLAGDERTPRTVVVSKFQEQLKLAERGLDTVIADRDIFEEQSSAIRAKTAIAQAKLLIEEENYQAALTKMVEVADLTKEAEEEAVEEEMAESASAEASADGEEEEDAEEETNGESSEEEETNNEDEETAESTESPEESSDDEIE
jgi:hypothetical protein